MKRMQSTLIVGLLLAGLGGCETTGGFFAANAPYMQPVYAPASPTNTVGLHDASLQQTYIGNLSANEFDPSSLSNPYGAGSPFNPNSINNRFGRYGSEFSPYSANNPYATNAPKLYDSQGNYRGRLSNNRYDPDSVSNPYGRYGNRFSPDSINNPFGAGNPFLLDSPWNPYGQGLRVVGEDDQ